jgi:polyhydroxybutyrate depolymerase
MTLPRLDDRVKIMTLKPLLLCLLALACPVSSAMAEEDAGRFQKWREIREHRQDAKRRIEQEPQGVLKDSYNGREMLVYVAQNAPPKNRAMVVILHGGMGNANHIFSVIGQQFMDAADEGGFVVAYLNGSAATRRGGEFHAWNAGGGCCGQPFEKNVDDIAYISRAVSYLADKYHVDNKKIFGMGHSNGAIMTQRLMCETDLYQAAIPISGPLNIDAQSCPPAYHKKIRAIHGELDENVPIGGGYGTKGISHVNFKSQLYSKGAFEESSAEYTIDIVKGTDHSLQNIANAIEKRDGRTLAREAALFFGLAPKY